MLQVARLAPKLLGEASGRVSDFFREHLNEDGGAKDRAGDSDLYYTVFGLEGLLAFQEEIPSESVAAFLRSFGAGDQLDLIHLGCLARCWAATPGVAPSDEQAAGILANIERYRAQDGSFGGELAAEVGTVYHAFIAHAAYEDLSRHCPGAERLGECVAELRTEDGAYANMTGFPVGSTPVTAAAVTLLRRLDMPVPAEAGTWLLAQAHREGGFVAAPELPMPDLLSTATALHALSGMQVDFSPIQDLTLDFIDTLWTGRAFCGHWADDIVDVEYSFYALLALGHLSL